MVTDDSLLASNPLRHKRHRGHRETRHAGHRCQNYPREPTMRCQRRAQAKRERKPCDAAYLVTRAEPPEHPHASPHHRVTNPWGGQSWPQPPFQAARCARPWILALVAGQSPPATGFCSVRSRMPSDVDEFLKKTPKGRLKGGCGQDWPPHSFVTHRQRSGFVRLHSLTRVAATRRPAAECFR